jgi:hypothetical protein
MVLPVIVGEIVIALDRPAADDTDSARCLIVYYAWKGFATGDTNHDGLHRGLGEAPNFETVVVCMYIFVQGSRLEDRPQQTVECYYGLSQDGKTRKTH